MIYDKHGTTNPTSICTFAKTKNWITG
uniref:Uncharacterized protein n=1 Tax=Arundo donax TaxID=35708 RepID=A0A0A9F8X6_ARUDO